jgi:hypothetical protein
MSVYFKRIANIVIYGGDCPDGISPARWNAMVKFINRWMGE